MVLILSPFENPRTSWISILVLFGFELVSSVGNRVTYITLEGQEPVLPGATKMTFIVPHGGLEESSLRGSESIWPLLAAGVV